MKAIKISALLLIGSVIAVYAASSWKFDQAHSKIQFSATHMQISEVTGEFKKYEGSIEAEGEDFSDAEIRLAIDVNSINTGIEKRDNHLKSPQFFHAEKHPQIKFRSTNLEKVDDNKYELTGQLTIRGKTQKEAFTAIHNGTITGMQGKTRSGWKITGTVNRFDYGLEWDKTLDSGGLVVGKQVDINCDVELIKQ